MASAASAASFNIAMKLIVTGLQGSFVAKQARANSLSERWEERMCTRWYPSRREQHHTPLSGPAAVRR